MTLGQRRRGNLNLYSVEELEINDATYTDRCNESCACFAAQSSFAPHGRAQRSSWRKTNENNETNWRFLPCDVCKSLYMKFPSLLFRMAPDEYVQQPWPSNRASTQCSSTLATIRVPPCIAAECPSLLRGRIRVGVTARGGQKRVTSERRSGGIVDAADAVV